MLAIEHVTDALNMQRGCELCEGVAALYCVADKAHICWTCDLKVHSANFLVARHTRSVLCTTCATPTPCCISGADPTPSAGLCTSCSHGESQAECTTHNSSNGTGSVAQVANSGGCSSNYSVERRNGDGDTTVRGESTSQLTVDSRSSVRASVSSRISGCHPSKPSCSSGGAAPCKQIATAASQDVNRSVTRGQCECSNSTSSSNRRRDSHAHQDTPCRDCNRSRVSAVVQAKRQRMEERASTRPGSPPLASTSRVMRILAKWHWDLHLSSPATVPLALRMYRKVSRTVAPAVLFNAVRRVTLVACLRLAAGLDEAQVVVPKASDVAACAGVSARRLAVTEIHLLALLGWRRFPMRAAAAVRA